MTSRNYKNSSALYERANKVIPLASQTFSKSRMAVPFGASPLFLERGKGALVWDVDGNSYLDFINGLLCISLGYQDSDVDSEVIKQMKKGVSFSLPHRLEAEVAERLVSLIPCAEKVRFGKNGTDVTSAAIRLARAYTNRDRVAVCGYHGWQDWYIGSTVRNRGVPKTTRELTHCFQYNDISSLTHILNQYPDEFAAVIMEPMNLSYPEGNFLEQVKKHTHKHGAVLIFDEIITGFRFSLGGAQQLFNVTPDLATFGKGMANGYPLSAVVGRSELMDVMDDIFFSGTFGGETLSLAAAKATIDKMEKMEVVKHIHNLGSSLMDKVKPILSQSEVFNLVGHPSWSILSVANDADLKVKSLFLQEMYKRGVLTLGSHNLSYAHDSSAVNRLVDAYSEVIPLLEESLINGNVSEMLKGNPIEAVFKVR